MRTDDPRKRPLNSGGLIENRPAADRVDAKPRLPGRLKLDHHRVPPDQAKLDE